MTAASPREPGGGSEAAGARADEKWDAYRNTILEFEGPPRLRVDLREPLDDRRRRALRELTQGTAFGVFTAENPAGENAEDAPTEREEERRDDRNERRTSRLEAELAASGVAFVAVDGVSPDGEYRERCVAARLPRAQSIALARRFEQLALFWFDGERFWLLPGLADKEGRPLP